MATRTIILTPSGLTVPDVSSGAYPTFPMPDSQITRCIIPLTGGVPTDFYSISSASLIIRSAATGNLYLRTGSTRFDIASEGAVEAITGTYTTYAGGAGTGITEFLTIPAAAYALTDLNPGDFLNLIIDRDATNASDTYNTDLDIIGIKFVYNIGPAAGTHYCTQADLEYRISTTRLAELTNDTANATTPDANVIEQILDRIDTLIDTKAGQVYVVPFTTIPDIIKQVAISLAVYDAFQRRPVNVEMPKMWQTERDTALKTLDDISNMLVYLPDTVTIASKESDIVTAETDKLVDFNDSDNDMSDF